MIEITVILAVAALLYAVSRATRLPEIPLLIVGGAILAFLGTIPEVPDPLPDREFVLGMLEVGLVFMLFVAGMDMSPGRVGDQRGIAMIVGVVQFAVLALLVSWLALRVNYELVEALYVGLAVSASSTLVVVRQLKIRREMFEPSGRMILGVLLLQDVLIVGALVFLAAVTHETISEMLVSLEAAAGLAVATVILARWVMPPVVKRYRDDDETLLLVVLATLFAFTGVAFLTGLPLVVAAFLAGLSLSGFPARTLVRGLLSSLSDFFLVIFFISLGALLQLPSLRAVLEALAVVLIVLVVTPLLVAYAAEKTGMTARGALKSGLLLAQTSEFSLVVALLGLETGQIGEELFSVIVMVTVVTMMVTPLWSSDGFVRWLMRFHPTPGPKTTIPERNDHVVVVGGGTAGTVLARRFAGAGVEVVIVDSDPMVVRHFHHQDLDAVWGDAEERATLNEAGVDKARAVVVTTGDPHHLEVVQEQVGSEMPIWFHVFEPEQAAWARERGARTVTYAEEGAESVVAWLDREMSPD